MLIREYKKKIGSTITEYDPPKEKQKFSQPTRYAGHSMRRQLKNNKFAWVDVIFQIESSLKSNSIFHQPKKSCGKSVA